MPAPKEYLATEIHTAPPQKLQLMLIEGAIRNIQLARQFWSERQDEAGAERIKRAQEIVGQLLAGLDLHSKDALVQRVASVYMYLVLALAQVHSQDDAEALDDVLRVLEIERGTWQQVCRELGAKKSGHAATGPHFGMPAMDSHSGQFSLEA
jgi:flagellar protein FliS